MRSVFDSLDNKEHSRQRKVLSHSFADKTLREIEPLLQGWARKLGDRLVKSASAPVDMATLYVLSSLSLFLSPKNSANGFKVPLHNLWYVLLRV